MTPGVGVAGEPAPLSGPGWGGISQHSWPLALGLSHLEVPALGSSLEGLSLLDPLLQSPFVPSGAFLPNPQLLLMRQEGGNLPGQPSVFMRCFTSCSHGPWLQGPQVEQLICWHICIEPLPCAQP